MERQETLERLKFLYDQVHQTAERAEHLQERVPLHAEVRSLNYGDDLERFAGEYDRLVRSALEAGVLTEEALAGEELPRSFRGRH